MLESERIANEDLEIYGKFIEELNRNNKEVIYSLAPIQKDRFFPFDAMQFKRIDASTGETISTSVIELKQRNCQIDTYETLIFDLPKLEAIQRYCREHNCNGFVVHIYKKSKAMVIHTVDRNFNYRDIAFWKDNVNKSTANEVIKGSKLMVEIPIKDGKIIDISRLFS